jgi:hypothetical protein
MYTKENIAKRQQLRNDPDMIRVRFYTIAAATAAAIVVVVAAYAAAAAAAAAAAVSFAQVQTPRVGVASSPQALGLFWDILDHKRDRLGRLQCVVVAFAERLGCCTSITGTRKSRG